MLDQQKKPILAIDSETHRFRAGLKAPPVVCLSYASADDSGLFVKNDIPFFLAGALNKAINGDLLIIGHHIAYDFACLIATFPELNRLIWDAYRAGGVQCTIVREKLLNIARGEKRKTFSLKELIYENFDIELDKDSFRLDYDKLENVPLSEWPEGAKTYAIDDSRYCGRLYYSQEDRAKVINYNLPDAGFQSAVDFALHLIGTWGIKTDRVKVEALYKQTNDAISGLVSRLKAVGIVRPNGTADTKKSKL